MDPRKKVWSNLRERAKPMLNLKIGKKKKKTPLKYRRSMSVPDLRFNPRAMMTLQDESSTPSQTSAFFDNTDGSGDIDDTASETSSVALSEHFSVADVLYSCSPAPSERSAPVDFPVLAETDKRQRATTWYLEDSDSVTGDTPPSVELQMTAAHAERRPKPVRSCI